MQKFLLYSSALFLLSGAAEAACIQTPTCSSLGYTSSSSCNGGIKCPFGNAWNCTIIDKITEITNKITTIEEKITVIEENGGSSSTPDYSNCKIGSILYSDFSCNENVVYTKEPIGVVFDEVNHLAVALEEKKDIAWSTTAFDIPGLDLHPSDAEYDGWGKKNTRVIYEYCKANGKSCPAVEYAYEYKTAGTNAGDWYLPSYVEMDKIETYSDTIDSAMSKINKKKLERTGSGYYYEDYTYFYWTSTAADKEKVYTVYFANYFDRSNRSKENKTDSYRVESYEDSAGDTITDEYYYIARPVLAF